MTRNARLRGSLVVPLALIALGVSAGASIADEHGLPDSRTVTKRVDVDSRINVLPAVVVGCPPGLKLLNTSWRTVSGQANINRTSAPSGVDEATFSIRRLGQAAAVVELIIECGKQQTKPAKEQGVAHSHALSQRSVSQQVQLPGRGGNAATQVNCPANFSPINGFFQGNENTFVEMSTPTPDGKGWRFFAENLGLTDVTARALVQCLSNFTGPARRQGNKNPRAHRHRVQREVVSKQVAVPSSPRPRQEAVTVDTEISCSDGFFPVGFGYAVLGHPFTFFGTFLPDQSATTRSSPSAAASRRRRKRKSKVRIVNQSTQQTAELAVVCLGEKTAK